MGKPGPDWTPAEDFVLKRSASMSAAELTALLPGRSKKAIQQRRIRLGSEPRFRQAWTPEEDALMAELAGQGKNVAAIAIALNRPRNGVKHRMNHANNNGGNFSYADTPPPWSDPWPDLGPNAFQDIKVSADPRSRLEKPVTQTAGGVGSAML